MFSTARARWRTTTTWRAITVAITTVAAVTATNPASAQRFPPPSNQQCWGEAVEIHGTQFNDTITVTAAKVTIVSGKTTTVVPLAKPASLVIATYGGNDNVSVQADIDTRTCLGTGNDSMSATAGSHRVESQGILTADLADGDDRIDADGTAGDLVTGGGDDHIVVENAVQNITTGAGDDQVVIEVDATAWNIDMGDGHDQLVIDNRATAHDIDMGDGDNQLVIDNDATVDDVGMGDGDDQLVLDDDATAGDVFTGDGDDQVRLDSGALVDDLTTGDGDDNVELAHFAYVDSELDTGAGWDTIDITGYGAARVIRAGAGNDTINAGDGHNTVYTGTGNDTLNAGGGFDRCHITSADDTVSNCELTYQQ